MRIEAHLARFRRSEAARPFVLAHRGARHAYPENTMRAFEGALAEGADGMELDVRATTDGELFLAHDDAIAVRGSERPAFVSRLSSAQLRALRLASGEPVPHLDDVLALHRERRFLLNVELKGDLPSPVHLARSAVRKLQRHTVEGLLVSSFDWRQLAVVGRSLPDVPLGVLIHDEQPSFVRNLPLATLFRARAMHPQTTLATPEAIARYRSAGLLVHVWTVNDPALAVALAERGVDSVITDCPGKVLTELEAR